MQELSLIVYFLLSSLVAGIVGTAGMTALMYFITRSGMTNANMVAAIGSMFTKSNDNATLVGATLHIISGVVFAMIYTLALNFMGVTGLGPLTAVGTGLGVGHGFVLSFLLVTSVASHHPLEEYREAGMLVAVAHFLGHIVYGLLVGFVIGLSGFSVMH